MDAAIAHKNARLEAIAVELYSLKQAKEEQDKAMQDQSQQVLFHQQQVPRPIDGHRWPTLYY
jgi:hypothetical protein